MNTDELRDYLGIALDMEKNILLRRQLIAGLAEEADKLGIPHTFAKPVKPQEWLPPAEPQVMYASTDETNTTSLGCLTSILLIPSYLIVCAIIEAMAGGNYDNYDFLEVFFVSVLVAFLLSFAFRSWKVRRNRLRQEEEICQQKEEHEKEVTRRYEQAEQAWQNSMSTYHRALLTYQHEVSIDKRRIQLENEQKSALQQQIAELTQEGNKSEQRLTQIYAKNIIFPKYRNLIALSSLYEYICAGRCSSLEGHEGAYNIYETEVRLDRIVTQLDEVIARLDAIRNNQFVLFSAIQEVNRQCSLILKSVQEINQKSTHILEAAWNVSDNIAIQVDSLDRQNGQISAQLQELQKTSTLAAYHTERTQKELAYMNRMDYLAGRNDDVFFNHPPVQ